MSLIELKQELEQLDLAWYEWKHAQNNDLSFGYVEINRLRDVFFAERLRLEEKYNKSLPDLRQDLVNATDKEYSPVG